MGWLERAHGEEGYYTFDVAPHYLRDIDARRELRGEGHVTGNSCFSGGYNLFAANRGKPIRLLTGHEMNR